MSREQIAQVLKEYRNLRGFSVASVCDWLEKKGYEIKQKTLYSYESGHRQPDADVLMALCDLYQIENILQAFGYADKDVIAAPASDQNNSLIDNLLAVCKSLNNDGLLKVIEYASDLNAGDRYKKTMHSSPAEAQQAAGRAAFKAAREMLNKMA